MIQEDKQRKYSLLFEEDKAAFEKKLLKKKQNVDFWGATYRLWSYRGCMTRDVLPGDCDDWACQRRVEDAWAKAVAKVHLMDVAQHPVRENALRE